jgi:DNA (cytosine-5)-methyltransferase 3A
MSNKPLNIISLFDGMSCGQIAINKFVNKGEYNWYASEIDKPAMNVTQHNFPDTKQIGDIRGITSETLKSIDGKVFMVMGGSPCTDLSIAGTRKGIVTKENIRITTLEQYLQLKEDNFEFQGQSYLFWEFIRVVKETKPKYFFLENVVMTGPNKVWEHVISNELGVKPIRINSSLVSAQNRDRLYWTNIPNVSVPEDREIFMKDIIEGAVAGYGSSNRKHHPTDIGWTKKVATMRIDNKANCLTKGGNRRKVKFINGDIRPLTVGECELLQTVPLGYTDVIGVCNTSRYAMLGNGWTVDVISHLFSTIPEFSKVKVF